MPEFARFLSFVLLAVGGIVAVFGLYTLLTRVGFQEDQATRTMRGMMLLVSGIGSVVTGVFMALMLHVIEKLGSIAYLLGESARK